MKIETELNAGESGYFLVDNEVSQQSVYLVRVTQSARYEGADPDVPLIEYEISSSKGRAYVPSKRAARTKAELLAKL